MNKQLRIKVYNKFGGRCAYCGRSIKYGKMQVDHYWPQFLKHHEPGLDNNRFGNLMPSCAKCNNHKHGMRPEVWRNELALQVARLKKNSQFDRALRFGQIRITESPIVFYFENYNQAIHSDCEQKAARRKLEVANSKLGKIRGMKKTRVE